MMENPTVAITKHESEVTVTETVISHLVGQISLEVIVQFAQVHDHVLMAQVDASEQRAGAALLILGEAVGSRLGIVGVVKDIIGIQTIALALESRENPATYPSAQAVDVYRTLVVLAVIGLDKDARCGKRELKPAVADEVARQQVSHVEHIGKTQAHARNMETEQRSDVTVHLDWGLPVAQVTAVEINPVVVLDHDFPLAARVFSGILHIGGIIVIEHVIGPTVTFKTEINKLGIQNARVIDVPSLPENLLFPALLERNTVQSHGYTVETHGKGVNGRGCDGKAINFQSNTFLCSTYHHTAAKSNQQPYEKPLYHHLSIEGEWAERNVTMGTG